MKQLLALALAVVVSNGLAAEATAPAAPEKEGPCKEIKEACQKAGFVQGEAKEGHGLWVDCIDPIMRGTAQPAQNPCRRWEPI